MNTSPDGKIVQEYKDAGGEGPIYGKVTGAFAADEATARRIAKERSPNSAMGGDLSTELALPRDFEAVAELVREDDLPSSFVLGNDPEAWRAGIGEYESAGFTHVCLHDVSEDQAGFVEFAKRLL